MNHFILSLVLAGLLIGDPFSLSGFCKNLWAESTNRFSLQVASCKTLMTTQKEIDRLKTFNLEAKYTTRVDTFNKKWFIVYLNNFKTKEEAIQYGKQLIDKNIIQNFRVFHKKAKEEVPARIKEPSASASIPFSLQVASLSTKTDAQKEIDRLKLFYIQAQYITKEDQSNRKWYVIYIDAFKTKEEATQYGKQLINKNIIQNFRVFHKKAKEEVPARVKESPASASIPSIEESKPLLNISPVYFGPIVIKEEETSLHINIFMDQKIFPEIMSDKISDGSRLMVTFKNIGKYIVPIEFDKVRSKALLSFSVANKGPDCIFVLLLSSSYNYEVSQNYYEKEKIYSLFIGMEAAVEPNRIIKE